MSFEFIIFGILVLIFSVVLHEVSHGYMADVLGDPTARLQGRLTLNPVSHIDLFGSIIVPVLSFVLGGFIFGWAKPVPFNPYNFRKGGRWAEALVAFAGPLSNIVLAIVFGLVVRFGSFSGVVLSLLTFVVMINVVLAIFNLVPVPPLDGSKILFSLLPYRYTHVRYTIERYGFLLVILIVVFLWQLIFPLVDSVFGLLTGL